MNDEEFDQLIERTKDTYRFPPPAPIEDMWEAIESEAWPDAAREQTPNRVRRDWRVAGLAAAAALALGVGLGRWSAVPPTVATPAVVASAERAEPGFERTSLARPLQRATTDYLGETAALLRQLQNAPDTKGAYVMQANTLLTTTRLLLDSPAVSDARLHELLEDLELILAQIATLPQNGGEARRREELQLIRSTLADRDVVPRMNTVVVTMASFDD